MPAREAPTACAEIFAAAEAIPQGRLLDHPAEWGTLGADRAEGPRTDARGGARGLGGGARRGAARLREEGEPAPDRLPAARSGGAEPRPARRGAARGHAGRLREWVDETEAIRRPIVDAATG